MTSELQINTWNYPTSVIAGPGSRQQLAFSIEQIGIQNPLWVVDTQLQNLVEIQSLIAQCTSTKYTSSDLNVFDQFLGNPNEVHVAEGIKQFNNGGHDGVIAIGGGSALDIAKAIALMAHQRDISLWQLEDVGNNWTLADASKIHPIIAIPTTAGTGSEVGRAAVITNTEAKKKVIIFHPLLLPKRVILDPELLVYLPSKLTAATGMDALAHNLEALCAPGYHPMAKGIALEGIRLIHENLILSYQQPDNLAARMHMLSASMMGATAFQAGLGAMHALAHPLGAYYNIHHGLLNAILMPYVLQMNADCCETLFQRLTAYLQLTAMQPNQSSATVLIDWILRLRTSLEIPHTLGDVGVDEHCLSFISKAAYVDPSASTNPKRLSIEDYQVLCCNAIKGILN
ncbi:iron-containing alcohol dehydrogenase [Zooshikella ganghwensis]|uniref:Iron-containing alcohol dehydrogenase n=1 Tax=Zooshikella ganghwensis TaxID=202772 RepID=A0A4P9VTB0_9GAMM|nr:iron-containing alcohol dehydrogenase [Zooshikella ganghwensis]RDH46099.1 iron-containing alcohol dehydrogenase [Zooshikella ganghwensis]